MPKISKILLLSVSVVLVLTVFLGVNSSGVNAATDDQDGAYRQINVYSEVLRHIQTDYVEEPNIPDVTDGALRGLLESLDSDSSYLTAMTMRSLWETRVSPNVVYSLQHLQNDTATLVIGGIDGVLRILDQNTGEVLSSCVVEGNMLSTSKNPLLGLERRKGRRLSEDAQIDSIPRSTRPPITCLAVGMEKVVTTHNSRYIRLWKFKK